MSLGVIDSFITIISESMTCVSTDCLWQVLFHYVLYFSILGLDALINVFRIKCDAQPSGALWPKGSQLSIVPILNGALHLGTFHLIMCSPKVAHMHCTVQPYCSPSTMRWRRNELNET